MTRIQANPDRDPINRIVDEQLTEHYRQQFRERFPGQCEQIVRLIAERLQRDLKNKEVQVCARDIECLAIALQSAYMVFRQCSN